MNSKQNLVDRILDPDIENVEAVIRAEEDYLDWCCKMKIKPHQSKVHSFMDARRQAIILTIPTLNNIEAYNSSSLVYYTHLIDDLADNSNLSTIMPNVPRSYLELKELSDPLLRAVFNKTATFHNNSSEIEHKLRSVKGIYETSFMMVCGALIQGAIDEKTQKRYAEQYKDWLLSRVGDNTLKRDLDKIHPMLLGLTVHIGNEAWIAQEEYGDYDIAKLLNLWLAPMLYEYDIGEEFKFENSRIKYGEFLSDGKFIKVDCLGSLVDIAESHFQRIPDLRKEKRFKMLQTAYECFKSRLSEPLRERYMDSLKVLGV